MKKFISLALSTVLLFACLPQLAFAATSSESVASPPNNVDYRLHVVSDGNNELQVPYRIRSSETQKVGEHQYITSHEVSVPLSALGVNPRSSISSEKDDDAITAKLSVTYYLKGEEIKITNISGGWVGSLVSLEMKNREVSITDGAGVWGFGEKSLTKYPTTNTFSYDTGWGYVPYNPHSTDAMSGPRCYSSVNYRIPSMGWDWHYLHFFLEIK